MFSHHRQQKIISRMGPTMDFAQVGFLVLLCLSFCSARRVLTDSTDDEKPNFARSFRATQTTGGLKSSGSLSGLGDSMWQTGGKGTHCSRGGGGGGGGGGGNGGCCDGYGIGGGSGGGSYSGGCGNFGCGGGGGGGYCGGNNGGCGAGCGCGGGGNYQGGCNFPPPPTCCAVSCPPVSNCCPDVGQPGYGHQKMAAQHWANSQAPPSPRIWANSQAPPRAMTGNDQDHNEDKPNVKKTENDEIQSESKFNADQHGNDSKPNNSDKETQVEQKTDSDRKNESAPPETDGKMQEDVSKNVPMN